jgi:hypothetical protein
MPKDSIAAKLNQFKHEGAESGRSASLYANESPLERTKKEVLAQIAASESYRVGILKTVATFSGRLGHEAYATAAQSMEEVYYNKKDDIIVQDDLGDSFYILEHGDVKVTVRPNFADVVRALVWWWCCNMTTNRARICLFVLLVCAAAVAMVDV